MRIMVLSNSGSIVYNLNPGTVWCHPKTNGSELSSKPWDALPTPVDIFLSNKTLNDFCKNQQSTNH